MFKSFFYLRKSDRKVIIALLCVIVIALCVIWFTGGSEESNALVAADTIAQKKAYRDSFRRQPYRERTVIVHTKVVYRDTAYRRGKALSDPDRDSLSAVRPQKIRQGEHVDLNTSDTTVLKTVPGIGSYFARKIVQYGERLGGYVSIDQLDEIEGFPLDAKVYFVVEETSPRRLDVNHLSLNELKQHPYLNFYQARAITDRRRLHGPLKSLDDLRLSKDFPPEVIARLQPYVEFR